MSRFLDISNYNNINNYVDFASSGLTGAICKASEGTTLQESSFNEKYDNLKSVGVRVGAYHMLCVTSQPETQAENFANQLIGKQLDIFPVLDVEYNNLKNVNEEYSNRFIAKFKELTGLDMIVYSCESYFNECFSDAFKNSHPLWVANYSHKPNMGNMVAWQFTDKCRDYSFVDGDVDCNELLDSNRFFINGSRAVNCSFAASPSVSTDTRLLELQRLCNQIIGAGIAEDNVWGPCTENAVHKLPLCGIPYHQSELTKWIQLRLGCNVDGVFLYETEDALKGWQSIHHLICDGICGFHSYRSLALD